MQKLSIALTQVKRAESHILKPSTSMPTPGLPLPPAMNQSSKHRLTSNMRARRASKEIKSIFNNTTASPTFRKRFMWFAVLLCAFLLGSNWGYKRAQPPRPPFAVDKLPPPPTPPTGFSITPDRKIPPIVHYVYGLSKDFGGKPFGFAQFVAMNSMLTNIKPEKVMVWYKYEPQGWWWSKIKEYAAKHGVQWEMKNARDVEEVFGNKVEHFAHKADIIRLEALKQHGGIYLDSDVFIIKDFKPLYRYSTVMGMESQPDITQELPTGICNAIILAQPYAPFISRWLDSYADFDRSLWATHSVARPWELARQYPGEITVLDKKAFFWPVWHTEHMQLIHETIDYDFDKSGQFAYHAWESLAWGWLAQWDPDSIWIYGKKEDGEPGETSLTRLARRWVPQELRNEWRKAKAAGLV